jgi:hypothetical protein
MWATNLHFRRSDFADHRDARLHNRTQPLFAAPCPHNNCLLRKEACAVDLQRRANDHLAPPERLKPAEKPA